jgi:isopentenyldiphosphate isomerase
LFQLRGPSKAIFPNKLDITAAGHYRQGENIRDASRELTEELGIDFSFEDLNYLGTRCEVGTIGKIINREFCEVYLLEHSSPLADYNLQEEEVTGLVEIELIDCMELFSEEVEEVTVSGVILKGNSKTKIRRKIKKPDMIPRHDNYYLIISIMAERYFDGKKYLAV